MTKKITHEDLDKWMRELLETPIPTSGNGQKSLPSPVLKGLMDRVRARNLGKKGS